MAKATKKEDIKKTIIGALEPFAGSIKKDFDRMGERFDKIDKELMVMKIETQEGFKEVKIRQDKIEARINETYNAVDGFIKIVDKLQTEFTVIKEDLKRVKEVIREKLGVDLV